MIDFLIAVLAIVFVLGVAINIHEFGHFAIAKLFGMRVDAYSLFGLGPRLFGIKIGHTDYRISAIPLGAYVKLYGDESNTGLEAADDQSDTVPESELYELRPRWQKFLVMLGGPFMNIVLALAIPFTMALSYGVPANPAPIVGAVKAGGAAAKAGLQPGDRIVSFDGVDNPSWERMSDDALLIPDIETPIVVERDGKRVALTITPTKVTEQGQSGGFLDMAPDAGVEPVVVGMIDSTMPAATSGLQKGDWILSVNDKAIRNTQEMKQLISENKEQPIKLTVDRAGQRLELTTNAVQKDNEWRIGIAFDQNLLHNLEPVGAAGAASYAVDQNLRILRLTGKALGQVGTGERSAKDTVSGPIGIGQVIVNTAFSSGLIGLISILMFISLSLGVMNLLPIPMLDGGQIMVLGIEKVMSWFGKTLSMAARERIQLTGLAIVLFLVVTVTFFDVSKMFGQ
ncbi:MAG: RIP metalloprotease RseP [Chloracidobacterium sp.]|nr:RIP metalloprotease RseP [Chloracidobacterium sp.]MCO5333791.1 RIP metalloprotease RseP [Pyrinomonadaceae bacterium]